MCHTSSQDGENQTLENEDSKLSYKETKNTNQKDTTKQDSDRPTNKSEPFAAAELGQLLLLVKKRLNQKLRNQTLVKKKVPMELII